MLNYSDLIFNKSFDSSNEFKLYIDEIQEVVLDFREHIRKGRNNSFANFEGVELRNRYDEILIELEGSCDKLIRDLKSFSSELR